MPSFDVVSEVEQPELRNAVDQARREIDNRFDFKGTSAAVELSETTIQLRGDAEFQLEQVLDIVRMKLAKRGIDVACMDPQEVAKSGTGVKQDVLIRQGIDADLAKKIQRLIKDSKIKVQASLQGDQVRVTGKKRDDLQQVIALLRAETFDRPLQYINFRD
ncbi:YajQ family cyclic di-GMP-binding protein [Thioalkalivibrio paradoxus]|uniref:Nucleotide-binding protein THITH_06585 n=1 Tax=Thioalkalivibrio paradoxus ARh 1 TaxID=713585 RepID=W0DL41_9GAMM|nr:YajQ family cyclic di-GMP-binding protein [Thioalkalivibrio paradoxus]AHE97977.1 nucleotide-binding protein [Thioalkalivibrio paradoxus ARh 1]